MMRFVFTGLAALGVLAAITFWSRPQEPAIPQLVLVPPPAPEAKPAPAPEAKPEPEPALAHEAEAPLEPAAHAVTRAAPSPDPAPTQGEPTLEEEELVVVERPDFEDGPGADPIADPDGEDPLASEVAVESDPAVPVDVERSGVLIRRMLALYDAIRD